jgi:hypothetical protein
MALSKKMLLCRWQSWKLPLQRKGYNSSSRKKSKRSLERVLMFLVRMHPIKVEVEEEEEGEVVEVAVEAEVAGA